MPARPLHHDEITFSMLYQNSENYVLPLSHDEVVHGKRSLLWSMAGRREEQFANLRLFYFWQWVHGGKKLLFMGGEFAQDREWAHDEALMWKLLDYPSHRGVSDLLRDLNRAYKDVPALHELDTETGGFEWIDAGDKEHSVLAVQRRGRSPGSLAVAVVNFSGMAHSGYRVGVPAGGRWREIVNTDSSLYGGQNAGNLGGVTADGVGMHGFSQSLELTLPALGGLLLVPENSR
jgi:1,4-alpha-glucan branching enzyme